MGDEQKRTVLTILPTVIQPPPHVFDDLQNVLLMVHLIAAMVWSPDTDIRFRLFGGDSNVYPGRDVFSYAANNRYNFHQITGESPESFIQLEYTLNIIPKREHKLSVRNRLLLMMMWVRTYPTYHMLSAMFGVSKSTVENVITELTPVLFATLKTYIK